MSNIFRLGLSGSSFAYVMHRELVVTAYMSARADKPASFDTRQNLMMQDFMRDMMRVMNSDGIAAMECYHSTAWDNEPIMEIILDNPNVEFWSLHAPYGSFYDPSSPDDEIRKNAIAAYSDAIEAAHNLGAGIVVAHPGANTEYDVYRDSRLGFCVDTYKHIADFAGERGIKLALEPLPKNEVGNTLDELLWIVENIGRQNVGINFDVNHLFPADAIPGLIRKAGEMILSVHISDQDDQERHWLPFTGKLNWKEVLKALADSGYKGPLVYETHIKEAQTCEDVGRVVMENYQELIKLAPAEIF